MQFKHMPAEDGSVDPEYRLLTDAGEDTEISIQDCRSYGGGFAVNEFGSDSDGPYMLTVATVRTLIEARQIAMQHYKRKES